MMKNLLNNYIKAYEELKAPMKWKVTDKRMLMTIASIYVFNNQSVNSEQLLHLAEEFKRQSSIFSPFRSNARYTTAAMLDVKFDQPEKQIKALLDLYDDFREAKFASGNFTIIAATILLSHKLDDPGKIILLTKEIYDGMKKEHAFLTSSSDYPLATLLALENNSDIIGQIEYYYQELAKNGFRKGNDLQFLSHILSLSKESNRNDLINRAIHVLDTFKKSGIQTRQLYYPIIGMLALLPNEIYEITPILSMYEELNHQKDFKWQKDMNLMMAASFYVNDRIEHKSLAETSLSTILESILQAQQAVMIATMSAALAANSSSSN
jgi:hypothetical protein